MPDPIWSMTYSASRRKHHHRCRVCNRIIRDGESVLMARVVGRKTKVIHDSCGEISTPDGLTERRLLELHGLAHLEALGYPEAKRQLDEQRISEIAARHQAADRACSRDWVCACGACKLIREREVMA